MENIIVQQLNMRLGKKYGFEWINDVPTIMDRDKKVKLTNSLKKELINILLDIKMEKLVLIDKAAKQSDFQFIFPNDKCDKLVVSIVNDPWNIFKKLYFEKNNKKITLNYARKDKETVLKNSIDFDEELYYWIIAMYEIGNLMVFPSKINFKRTGAGKTKDITYFNSSIMTVFDHDFDQNYQYQNGLQREACNFEDYFKVNGDTYESFMNYYKLDILLDEMPNIFIKRYKKNEYDSTLCSFYTKYIFLRTNKITCKSKNENNKPQILDFVRDLTLTSYELRLLIIMAEAQSSITQKEIAEEFGFFRPKISVAMNALIEKNYVVKQGTKYKLK